MTLQMTDPFVDFLEELGLNSAIVANIAKRRADENKIIVANIVKRRALEDRIKQEIETTILMDTLRMGGTIEDTLKNTSKLYKGILEKFESAQQHSEQGSLDIYETPKKLPRNRDVRSANISTDFLRRNEARDIDEIGFPLDMDSLYQSLESLESLESSLDTGSSLESSLDTRSILKQSLTTSWRYSDSSASECSSIYVDTLIKSINSIKQSSRISPSPSSSTTTSGIFKMPSTGKASNSKGLLTKSNAQPNTVVPTPKPVLVSMRDVINGVYLYIKKKIKDINQVREQYYRKKKLIKAKRQQEKKKKKNKPLTMVGKEKPLTKRNKGNPLTKRNNKRRMQQNSTDKLTMRL